MALTDEQKAMRRTGCGGSDIAAILGVSPSRGPLDVYLSKEEGWEQPVTSVMELGNVYEPATAALYAQRTGAEVAEPGTLRHCSIPIALCTPDRLAKFSDGGLRGYGIRDLSIKVPWHYLGQWGESGTDEIPVPYLLQLQWETMILRSLNMITEHVHHLAAPIDGDLRIFEIEEDEEIQATCLDAAKRFWRDHVEPKKPPDLDGSGTATEWLKKRFKTSSGALLDATPQDEVLALELKEACQAHNSAEARKELAKQRLKERIGSDAGLRTADGVVSWKPTKKGNRVFRHPYSREH
jgi:putative phage-type endonuclease